MCFDYPAMSICMSKLTATPTVLQDASMESNYNAAVHLDLT